MEQELITAEQYASQEDTEAAEENARLMQYHQVMLQMSDDLPPRGIPHIAGLNRKRVMQAFMDSFELIGGVPALALWGQQHPSEFYKLFARLLPSQSQTLVQNNQTYIQHVLPPSALDE